MTKWEDNLTVGYWWLMLVILATQEAQIRRIAVQSQPWANSLQDPLSKIPNKHKHTHTHKVRMK
jgi:hypothetical protein